MGLRMMGIRELMRELLLLLLCGGRGAADADVAVVVAGEAVEHVEDGDPLTATTATTAAGSCYGGSGRQH